MSVVELIELDRSLSERRAARGERAKPPTRVAAVAVGGYSMDNKDLWTKGIRKRRSVPIRGYVGTSGHGKSASMVRDMLPSLAMGRPILSTVEILDAFTGNPHPLYIPFTSFRQLDSIRDGDVLMDEITGIMDSHDAAMPKRVRQRLPQMRRSGNFVSWSGISWDNSNLRLRQMTQAVTVCKGLFPNRGAVNQHDGSTSLWAPNRAFMLKTFDAQKLMKSEDAQRMQGEAMNSRAKRQTKPRPKVLALEFWRGSTSLAFRSYDTMGDVLGVNNGCDHILANGKVCGGRVPDPVCKGHG